MGWLIQTFRSSLGKKLIMALTGAFLLIFLAVHLFGNLFLYAGKDAFNLYVHTLEETPGLTNVIRLIEIVLALGFIFHIADGLLLTYENKVARGPQNYAVKKASPGTVTASRFMFVTGSVIFIFLILHLRDFWFEYKYGVLDENRTPYDIVAGAFQIPLYSTFYVLAMILIGYHLYHGFQSVFQTLGWNHKKYTPILLFLGRLYAIVIAAGFASLPIYFLFFKGGN